MLQIKPPIEQKLFIDQFKAEFLIKFGNAASVNVYKLHPTHKELQSEILKKLLKDVNNFSKTSDRIEQPCRNNQIVNLRTIYIMLANDLDFTLLEIGDSINRHHATVIYNLNIGYDQLELYEDFRNLYIEVSTFVNPEIYPHARINKITDTVSDYTRSNGSIRMRPGKYQVTRPAPRQGSRLASSERKKFYQSRQDII